MLMIRRMHSSLQTQMLKREKFRLMPFLPTSLIKCLLRTYYVSGAALGTEKWQWEKGMKKSLPS